MTDALRLAVGTLTVLRVPAPQNVNRRVARRAMVLAPAVGLLLGLVVEAAALLLRWAFPGSPGRLVVAAASVGLLAALTRAIHLDGLADTADGLGSGRTGANAREVMKRPDIGPFGVVTLVLVLMVQTTGLYVALQEGRGTLALVGGVVVSRLAITWACRCGVPAASQSGLGSVVADTVPVPAAAASTIAVLGLLAVIVWIDDDLRWTFLVHVSLALVAALVAAGLLVYRCVRRFEGVTGDVLGAACETAFTTFVLVVAAR